MIIAPRQVVRKRKPPRVANVPEKSFDRADREHRTSRCPATSQPSGDADNDQARPHKASRCTSEYQHPHRRRFWCVRRRSKHRHRVEDCPSQRQERQHDQGDACPEWFIPRCVYLLAMFTRHSALELMRLSLSARRRMKQATPIRPFAVVHILPTPSLMFLSEHLIVGDSNACVAGATVSLRGDI
jgi:hypothetical protein